MAYTIGPTLSVQGEKEYNKAMDAIRNSMKYVKAEANAITSAYDKNDKSVAALTARNQGLKAALEVQKKAVEEATKALERMDSEGIDPSSEAYQRMTANLNNAQAELNKTNLEIAANEEAMKGSGGAANGFAAALRTVGEVAGKAVVATLKATAAAMAAIGAAAIAAAKAVWDMGKASGDWADEVLTMSQQTGLSVKTLQELQYAARFVDVEVSTLSKGMARTVAAMRESVDAGRDYIEAAGGLKIAMKDAAGATKSTEQIFYETIDALGAMEDATLREVAAQDLFGRSYQELMPLINAGSSALKEYAEEARKMGLVLSDEMVAKLGSFDDVMERTEAQMDGLKRQLAVVFLPALQSVGTGISELLSVITTSLSDGIQAGDIKRIGQFISDNLMTGLREISKYIPEVVSIVSGMMTEAVKILVATMPMILPTLMEGAFQLIQGLVDAVVSNVEPLALMVAEMATNLAIFIVENLPLFIDAAAQIVVAIAQGLSQNIPTLIPAIVEAIMVMANSLIENVGMIIPAAIQIIIAIVQGIMQALPQLISYIPTIVQTITSVLLSNLPLLINGAIQIIVAIITGIGQAIPQLIQAVPQIIQAIVNALAGLASQLWEAGKNIVQGIWEGISRASDWLKEKVTGFFSGIIGGIKNFLGIKSPSKVFAGIGENMAQGLGIGFKDAMKSVSKSMQQVIPSTDVSLNVNGTNSGRLGPVTINLNVNGSIGHADIDYLVLQLNRKLGAMLV